MLRFAGSRYAAIAMRRSAWALGLAVGACFSPACGSSSSTTTGAPASSASATSGATSASSTSTASASTSGAGTGGAGSSTSGMGGAGGDATASGTGGTSPNDLCVQTGRAGACRMCCASDEAAGFGTYVGALIQYCACTAGAACYAQCSADELCSNPSAQTGSAACIGCVNAVASTDPCFTATTASVNATCDADPGCAALVACDDGCVSLPM